MTTPRNTVLLGDCIELMRTLDADSVDAIVCDPPYGLEFMGKAWDSFGGGFSLPGIGERETEWPSFTSTSRTSTNNPTCATCGGRARGATKCACETPEWKPMGKRRNPDNERLGDGATSSGMLRQMRAFQEFNEAWAREAYRVAKPGAYLVAFGGTRTYHRLVAGIEEAGWEIRDQVDWIYGVGFPKSKNLPGGWGTALKPAHEPIVVARKPMAGTVAATFESWGTGVLNIEGCRIGDEAITVHDAPTGTFAGGEVGRGSDTESYRTHTGRWPANVVLDEEAAALLDAQTGTSRSPRPRERLGTRGGGFFDVGSDAGDTYQNGPAYGDEGGASRFFYCAKASRKDRDAGLDGLPQREAEFGNQRHVPVEPGSVNARFRTSPRANSHPTVKPSSLMRWLVRLVGGPAGSLILDPFAGSGSTLRAAADEGHDFLGIEMDAGYYRLACLRAGLPDPEADEMEMAA